MPRVAIEIQDAGILAVGEDGRARGPASPAVALIDDHGVIVGADAAARARLNPKRVHDRFWSELEQTPLGKPFPPDLTIADLAHAHLAKAWGRIRRGVDSAFLVVPGSSSERQLALLLGVARACRIPVRGLVDAAVAAAAGDGKEATLLHLDLQPHRAVLTEMSGGDVVSRRSVKVVSGTGLRSLHDLWLRQVAKLFVSRTRFDPLHSAETDQELWALMPDLVERLCTAEMATVQLGEAGGGRAVEVPRSDLLDAATGAYDTIVRLVRTGRGGEEAPLLLSARAAALPGLADRLAEEARVGVHALRPESAAAGALARSVSIESTDEALPFVTRLPTGGAPAPARHVRVPEPAAEPPPVAEDAPSHLVHDGHAYPLGPAPLVLGATSGPTLPDSGDRSIVLRDGVLFLAGSTHASLNGRAVRGEVELRVGDRLQLGSTELLLIRLVSDHGPA